MNTPTQTLVLQTYAVDAAHSRAGFTVRHMGFSKVRGRFETFDGTVRMAPGDLSTLEAEATLQTASIATGDAKRNAHLRSPDFFEAETYPTLTFKSTGVRDVDGDRFTLVGDLTMHGITKTVELDGEYLGEGTDPWGGTRVAFEAETTVNRKEWGLNWNTVLEAGGLLVSEDVTIELEIQATLQQDDA
ncbi:MAG: YceI family protein [Rhodothermaceae bacterium]|nr:YceI family protein [Rhodothermaceae bacterium]